MFTTNYELCFERSASELGLVALDGFSFFEPRRFDPRYFEYDIEGEILRYKVNPGHSKFPGLAYDPLS